MRWELLTETLENRKDVTEFYRSAGFGTLDEMLAFGEGVGQCDLMDGMLDWLVDSGPVGREVALAVLVPRLRQAVSRINAQWAGYDAGEMIVSEVWQELAAPPLSDRPSVTIVAKARKRVVRQLQREVATRQTEVTVGGGVDYADETVDVETEAITQAEEASILEWLGAIGVADTAARVVVATRLRGVPMATVAEAEGIRFETACKARQRAEKKIRRKVVHQPDALLTI